MLRTDKISSLILDSDWQSDEINEVVQNLNQKILALNTAISSMVSDENYETCTSAGEKAVIASNLAKAEQIVLSFEKILTT